MLPSCSFPCIDCQRHEFRLITHAIRVFAMPILCKKRKARCSILTGRDDRTSRHITQQIVEIYIFNGSKESIREQVPFFLSNYELYSNAAQGIMRFPNFNMSLLQTQFGKCWMCTSMFMDATFNKVHCSYNIIKHFVLSGSYHLLIRWRPL